MTDKEQIKLEMEDLEYRMVNTFLTKMDLTKKYRTHKISFDQFNELKEAQKLIFIELNNKHKELKKVLATEY